MGFLLYLLPLLLLVIGPLLAYYCYRGLSNPLAGFDSIGTGFSRVGNWAGIVLGIAAVFWAIWRVYQLFSQP